MIRFFHCAIAVWLFGLLLLSDFVALQEIRHSLSWIVGERATVAAFAMLFLANSVTLVFFFPGLTHNQKRQLHGIAGAIYGLVWLAMYATGVQHGQESFPVALAHQAFGLSQPVAVRLAAFLVAAVLAGTSFSFWRVIGSLINRGVTTGTEVRWQAGAERLGMRTENIFDLGRRQRAVNE
ncbi:MAG TPA: hypothetical protein VNZ55_13420 [Thermomicrobiales bacterium]|nr:hypothetical protein [Thermomicrobiales bacterium]